MKILIVLIIGIVSLSIQGLCIYNNAYELSFVFGVIAFPCCIWALWLVWERMRSLK